MPPNKPQPDLDAGIFIEADVPRDIADTMRALEHAGLFTLIRTLIRARFPDLLKLPVRIGMTSEGKVEVKLILDRENIKEIRGNIGSLINAVLSHL